MQPLPVHRGEDDGAVGRLVVRNTLYLTISQVVTIPMSVAINAMLARYLGAVEFGYIYLAGTMATFGGLVVDWGHLGALPALVARDGSRAGALLGTSLTWRLVLAGVVYAVLAIASRQLGYTSQFQWALGLTFLCSALSSFVAACKDTIRGFERTDIVAYAHVAQQLLTGLLVIPVLMLGGQLREALIAAAVAVTVVLLPMWRTLKPAGVGDLRFDRQALRSLMSEGTPFVFMGLAMSLQPNVDAIYLSKLAPEEVMGWFGATRRLIGVLLLPVSALIGALYPTLCRLYATDAGGFTRASNSALRGVSLAVIPVALGCALYPEIGISIFNRSSFGPAEANLRVLSVFLLLVYFTMVLGTCLMAGGRQRAWSVAQSLCVLASFALDPILIPWFQHRYGNGGLGVCVAGVVSEVLMLLAGVLLIPRGILDRRLGRSILLAFSAGAAMAAVAFATHRLSPFLGAPLAVVAYLATLLLTGAVEKDQLGAIRSVVARKLRLSNPPPG